MSVFPGAVQYFIIESCFYRLFFTGLAQFKRIEHCLPAQSGNVGMTNLKCHIVCC